MRCFAILPAAGRSVRMGTPKLLLPWPSDEPGRPATTLIEHVLATWQASRVAAVVVTVHPADVELAHVCRAAGADVVVPAEPPPDMKASIRAGLAFIAANYDPQPADVWLTAPADLPLLTTTTIDHLIAAAEQLPGVCLRPRHGERFGHPVVWPWPLAAEVARLGADEGLNALFGRIAWQPCDAAADCVAPDIDTPADYRASLPPHNRHDA